MTGTNPKDKVEDDDREVTEEDLRNLKYPKTDVEATDKKDAHEPEDGDEDENSEEAEEKGDDGKEPESEDSNEDDDSSEENTFIKEFPKFKGDTVEEYTRSLEKGYGESTAEALRLVRENETLHAEIEALKTAKTAPADDKGSDKPTDKPAAKTPSDLWVQQKVDEEIAQAWTTFSKDYSQVEDATAYKQFTQTVQQLATTILHTENRMAPAKELYPKAAAALGWEKQSAPSDKEKLKMALKTGAAIQRTGSPATKKAPKSKVTDEMVATNMRMYPGKTEKEIREELEEYVQ